MLSQGVPMLLAGDESGRTQQGNNNAYCQDNEISWVDWDKVDTGLQEFARRLVRFRHDHPVFRRRRWFQGQPIHGGGQDDIAWFNHMGEQASEELWVDGEIQSLGIFLNGDSFPNPNARGEPVKDDSFYLIFNAHFEPIDFVLPPTRWGPRWQKILDTNEGWVENAADKPGLEAGAALSVMSRSLVLLQRQA
jgi:glycogen operon protein